MTTKLSITGDTRQEVSEDGVNSASGRLKVDTGSGSFTTGSFTSGYGQFSISADGSWQYTLDNSAVVVQQLAAGSTVTDSFFVSWLGSGEVLESAVQLIIYGVNDPARIGGNTQGLLIPGSNSVSGVLTIADTDVGENLFSVRSAASGSAGTFSINADGAWTYTLNNGAALPGTGEDFSVTSVDGSTASVKIRSGDPANLVRGSAEGNDITNPDGSQFIDGDAGLDTLLTSASRFDSTLIRTPDGFALAQNNTSDTLKNIERIVFSDGRLALDLDGNAGIAARAVGALLGASAVSSRPDIVGIALAFVDAGGTLESLMAAGFNALGVTSPDAVVALLWQNLLGSPPGPGQAQPLVDIINGGTSIGAFGALAAGLDLNASNINLTGLADTGLAYL